MTAELNDMLVNQMGAIPFGNKKTWLEIQESDADCRVVHSLKAAGNLPVKKTNSIIIRLFRECTVKLGLQISRGEPPRKISRCLSRLHLHHGCGRGELAGAAEAPHIGLLPQ